MKHSVASLLLSTSLSMSLCSAEVVETIFATSKQAPSPAVIAAAPTGEVYVGIDMQGSLGKKVGLGKIVRLVDKNANGKADQVTTFAKVDNPRGIIALGDKILVLHTTVKNGKYENQQLSLFKDEDKDGVADGAPIPLVKNIGNQKFLRERGADHSTNNIRYAIDGWIYISVGDFGFVDATGTDGKKLTLLGGGIVRVRTDGTGLEVFMKGTRNVYDVAIDSFLNVFTRENTNDGIGWWARSSHYIQSADYGYPSLYTNFQEDIIPAMAEYGSGSGTGALFLDEPTWPEPYNKKALLADWGHSKVYMHSLNTFGATFTNRVQDFYALSQVSDLDIDGSGRIYLSAWDGAGYQGSKDKGMVTQIVPKGWRYKPFPVLKKESDAALLTHLKSDSLTARVNASYEIVSRKNTKGLLDIVKDKKISLESRIAAIYTFSQIKGEAAQADLKDLFADAAIREHVIRAMTDDLTMAKKADVKLITTALDDSNERVQAAAIIALGRIGDKSVVPTLLPLASSPVMDKGEGAESKAPTFQSKTLASVSKSVGISASIESFSQLVLIVDELGQNKFDEAAWINPTIHLSNGKTIDLTKLTPKSVSMDRGSMGVDKDCNGAALKFKKKKAKGIGVHARSEIVYELPEGAQKFTATGILTLGAKGPKNKIGKVLFAIGEHATKPVEEAGYIPPTVIKAHSTPRKGAVLPHLARKAIVALAAEEEVATAIKSATADTLAGALSAAKEMHATSIVDALVEKAQKTSGEEQFKVLEVLARLHQKEKAYEGLTWWKTRPNPDGPYYTAVDWEGTPKVNSFFSDFLKKQSDKKKYIALLKKQKAYVTPFNTRPKEPGKSANPKDKKIGDTAIEDIVTFVTKQKKADTKNGAKVITQVGCAGCHNIDATGVVKGPDLTKLGKMKLADLTEAIIKPGATIAASWRTITMKDGSSHTGTIVKEDKNELTLHNIAGQPTVLKIADIKSRADGLNMMSLHLCDDLTLQQFNDLLGYLKSLDKTK